MPLTLSPRLIADVVKQALKEDVGPGDVTTNAIAKPHDTARGAVLAQAKGVIAGVPLAQEVYRQLSSRVKITVLKKDGSRVKPGDAVLRLAGPAAPILTGERTALNFLGLMSGTATRTAEFADAVGKSRSKIYDTRKTPPGLRALVKYAVLAGGGCNHRLGLYDAVLIKDNHIRLAGSVTEAIQRVRTRTNGRLPIEVEAENLAQVMEALDARADIILLDNLDHGQLKQAVRLIRRQALTEVSGGVNFFSARRAAALGVDRISVGALTHSAPWLSLHLELE